MIQYFYLFQNNKKKNCAMKKQNIETKEAEIRKKLAQSGITSAQEFEEIISNLKNQKERLEYDL